MGVMPWKEIVPVEQRLRFVIMIRHDFKNFSEACRYFGISRKTGYKWWERFEREGLAGLEERSRRPRRSPNAISNWWFQRILFLKKERVHWGPKKIRGRLLTTTVERPVPASSTIGRILAAAGLVRRGRKRRPVGPVVARPTLSTALSPNEIWAVDFKGWFRLGNGERCEPLTVSDLCSRYILCCVGGKDVSYAEARPVFEILFQENGQPAKIRVDNGPPFGSRGAAGLGRLAVWWISLGIQPEFIHPGHPEQNGSHERMHRTLKAEAIEPVAYDRRAQQKQFDRWRWEFNHVRPHESLGQATPESVYRKSSLTYRGPVEPTYPPSYIIRRVRTSGEIRWRGGKRFIGEAFVGQTIGISQSGPGKHLVYFHHYLLGEIDDAEKTGMKPAICIRSK